MEPHTIKAHVDKCMIEWSRKNINAIQNDNREEEPEIRKDLRKLMN